MRYTYHDAATGALLRLHVGEPSLGRDAFRESAEQPLTIIWNRGDAAQTFHVDGLPHALGASEVASLTMHQTFAFDPADTLVAWQFNREFYCIVDHDAEVSCTGLIFFGPGELPVVRLDAGETERYALLLRVFEDEFRAADNLQGEMLRVLLKRLIVLTTRLYKDQRLPADASAEEVDTLRRFAMLVERHFRELHRVADYADLMHRSPKTLANAFARDGGGRTPLQVIHERIALEAKRRLLYTDDTAAEVGYALGFGAPAHFSRFFKRLVGESPAAFRRAVR